MSTWGPPTGSETANDSAPFVRPRASEGPIERERLIRLRSRLHNPVTVCADYDPFVLAAVPDSNETVIGVAPVRLVFGWCHGEGSPTVLVAAFAQKPDQPSLPPSAEGQLADLVIRFTGGSLPASFPF